MSSLAVECHRAVTSVQCCTFCERKIAVIVAGCSQFYCCFCDEHQAWSRESGQMTLFNSLPASLKSGGFPDWWSLNGLQLWGSSIWEPTPLKDYSTHCNRALSNHLWQIYPSSSWQYACRLWQKWDRHWHWLCSTDSWALLLLFPCLI